MITIKIELEFDNINPTTQDVIDYVNELGEDLDYTVIDYETGLIRDNMSITFVYRDENNKVQVKKVDYEEVKKDLMKYLSHDIRSIIKEKEKDETASDI